LLAGIALGISMLPEEFPVVLAVFMAMGAWRISRARVLTRRASAIETLGSATILCTDKTGTLTENRMTIAELWLRAPKTGWMREAKPAPMPKVFQELTRFGLLASAPEPFDPMDKAFHALSREQPVAGEHLQNGVFKLVHAYGLRPDLLAITQVW
jgi:Ca2+-transporting ATPase